MEAQSRVGAENFVVGARQRRVAVAPSVRNRGVCVVLEGSNIRRRRLWRVHRRRVREQSTRRAERAFRANRNRVGDSVRVGVR